MFKKYKIPVSVIMPCHNSASFLRQAIDSILNQVFEDFEFIIIDDGSTDSTGSIISEYSDSRIRVLSKKNQTGNFACRNMGMLEAVGKYICVMDSDDISLPNRLHTQQRFMEKNKHIGLIGSNAEKIDVEGKSLGLMKKIPNHSQLKVCLLKDSICVHPTVFFRSNIIFSHQLMYNEKMKFAADYDFLVKCSQRCQLRNLPQVLLKYRSHTDQISTARRKEQEEYANEVRLSQLGNFKIKLTQNEEDRYLSLMMGNGIHPEEQLIYLNLFNRLLDANYSCRFYSHPKLLLFFKALLANGIQLHQSRKV